MEGPPTRARDRSPFMRQPLPTSAEPPRGSELLEEFLGVVPSLAKLGGDVEARAWATIALLAQMWECLLDQADEPDGLLRSDVISGLRRLHAIHGETNATVACGVLIIALVVEASSLDDEDARLVRSLTALHVGKRPPMAA